MTYTEVLEQANTEAQQEIVRLRSALLNVGHLTDEWTLFGAREAERSAKHYAEQIALVVKKAVKE